VIDLFWYLAAFCFHLLGRCLETLSTFVLIYGFGYITLRLLILFANLPHFLWSGPSPVENNILMACTRTPQFETAHTAVLNVPLFFQTSPPYLQSCPMFWAPNGGIKRCRINLTFILSPFLSPALFNPIQMPQCLFSFSQHWLNKTAENPCFLPFGIERLQ